MWLMAFFTWWQPLYQDAIRHLHLHIAFSLCPYSSIFMVEFQYPMYCREENIPTKHAGRERIPISFFVPFAMPTCAWVLKAESSNTEILDMK